ncbi:hypothetical protein CFSAN001628_006764 [Clostridium botulinum CFSAN001628]|nr:hypothetical protein CFSAN001628_006764 [Clostridium botulinum CFSAN001628]RUT62204.1 hypothetical protein C1143_05930 [Clostridium botulinum]
MFLTKRLEVKWFYKYSNKIVFPLIKLCISRIGGGKMNYKRIKPKTNQNHGKTWIIIFMILIFL